MSEDKMREEHWRQWGIAGMPKDKIRLAEETWKAATEACAAIKDAEIAKLKDIPMKYKRMEFNAQLQHEIASRDLMIKELREALNDIANPHTNNPMFYTDMAIDRIYEEIAQQALAKSEHHNSKALEKMLLEARISALEDAWQDIDNCTVYHIIELLDEVRGRMAKLNSNTDDNEVLATVVAGSFGPNTIAE